MSVSDVVEIPASTGENDFYFCEPIGYKKILFDKNRAMLPIVNHDYRQEEKIKCGVSHVIFPRRCWGKYVLVYKSYPDQMPI